MASSTAAAKREWLVILRDHEDVVEKRMSVRGDHLKGVKPKVESGWLQVGAGILERQPAEGESPVLKGTVLVVRAERREEVLEELKRDPYYQHDVWDWSQMQIYPLMTAVRASL